MKKNKVFLSIIIPVFNVEKYLPECLESIITQTFKDLEIIIIDDGSTDNSLKICKRYLKKCDKIILISKKNGGVSSARNLGILKAEGQYIMFMDADDFLMDNKSLEKIKNSIVDDQDVFIYNMAYCYNNDKSKLQKLSNFPIVCENDNLISLLIENNKLSISPCDKWINKKILLDYGLFFDKNLQNLEDADWSLNIYSKTKKIQIIDEYVYVYRKQRENSASTKITNSVIENHKCFIERWSNKDFELLPQNIIQNYLSYQYIIILGMIAKNKCYKENYNFIHKYKFLLKTNSCKKVKIVNIFSKLFGIKLTSIFLKQYLNYRARGGKLL